MALTLVNPPAGAPMGYGQACLLHSSTPPVGTEVMNAELVWLDGLGVPRRIAAGSGIISGGSLNASVTFGISYFGEWQRVSAGDPRGAPLGAQLELNLTRYDNAGATAETATIAAAFVHDPVSQLAHLVHTLPPAHDPMLDAILAAVQTTFPST